VAARGVEARVVEARAAAAAKVGVCSLLLVTWQ
jgi:hypothetical protein